MRGQATGIPGFFRCLLEKAIIYLLYFQMFAAFLPAFHSKRKWKVVEGSVQYTLGSRSCCKSKEYPQDIVLLIITFVRNYMKPARKELYAGLLVRIIQKEDQHSGKLTEGAIRDILTGSAVHPHGIKVRLETGEVGRVQQIIEDQG